MYTIWTRWIPHLTITHIRHAFPSRVYVPHFFIAHSYWHMIGWALKREPGVEEEEVHHGGITALCRWMDG